jgi:hypothetical protein
MMCSGGGVAYLIGGESPGPPAQSLGNVDWRPSGPDAGAWRATTSLAAARAKGGCVVFGGRVFVFGGDILSGGTGTVTATVQVADVLADGGVGAWTVQAGMPYARAEFALGAAPAP